MFLWVVQVGENVFHMHAKTEVLQTFIEEVSDGLLVTLQERVLCFLWRGAEIACWVVNANQIKESFKFQSVLTLNDATLVSA